MHEKKELGSFYATVIFGIAAAAVVLFFCSFLNYKEKRRESGKAEETKAAYTEEAKVKDTEDAADDLMQRLQNVDWENVYPKKLEDTDYQMEDILLLAEIPEENITMYGYNDAEYQRVGVAIFMGDTPSYFEWCYTSPRLIMPQMYWNQSEGQLQISLHNFTGTGLAAEELHVLRRKENGELEDFFFVYDDYVGLFRERLAFSFDEETGRFSLCDQQENKELCSVDLSKLLEDEGLLEEAEPGEPLVEDFAVGDIAGFVLGDEIRLRVQPGYMVNCWATPQYDEMPELEVDICMEESEGQIHFSLGDIRTVK